MKETVDKEVAKEFAPFKSVEKTPAVTFPADSIGRNFSLLVHRFLHMHGYIPFRSSPDFFPCFFLAISRGDGQNAAVERLLSDELSGNAKVLSNTPHDEKPEEKRKCQEAETSKRG